MGCEDGLVCAYIRLLRTHCTRLSGRADEPVDQRGIYFDDIFDVAQWSCPAYVPVPQLIYAAFRSKAKGLLLPSDEWRRRGL